MATTDPSHRQIVSYSELSSFRQCPLKHALEYKQRWTKPVEPETPLSKGSLWHLVMQTHYGVLRRAQEVFGRRIHEGAEERAALGAAYTATRPLLVNEETGEQNPDQELVEWMYDGYVARWGADRNWLVIAMEHAIELPLLTEQRRPSPKYRIKMKLDLVVKDREGKLWVVDHKSCYRLPYKNELDLDDQFGLYTWAMRRIGHPVIGSMHSASRTFRTKGDAEGKKVMPTEDRFSRTPIYRSDIELDNLALDAHRVAKALGAMGHPYSAPDPNQCGWKCQFKEAHLLMRKGIAPRTALTDLGFRINKERH